MDVRLRVLGLDEKYTLRRMKMTMTETPKPTQKERVFVADNREFPDPDATLSVDEIKKILADFMPELHNAEVPCLFSYLYPAKI